MHNLNLLDSTAEDPTMFFINEFTGMIEADPQLEEEIGKYTFVIEACVSVQYGMETICANSA